MSDNAIAHPKPPLSQSDFNKFQGWIKYLLITNDDAQNKPILLSYFFDKFASSPQLFYFFLEYFKEHISSLSDQKAQKVLAQKFLDILSPHCERFNFFEERNSLNDLCFKILEPEEYEGIRNIFAKYEKQSKEIIEKGVKTLDAILKAKNYEYELVGRYKNTYSIHKKVRNFGKRIIKISDIFGFRIILNSHSAEDCFRVVNLLHDIFQPIPGLFNDYISIPKINGYQSLHTGLEKMIDTLDLPVEIQIRTREMHNFAENGLAAHWLYARDKKSRLVSKKEQQLLNHLSCLAHSSEKENYLYCFSYTGDMLKMPKNSTIVDFAYQIHTDLGNKIKLAFVNGEEKPLYYRIKEGDQVEIIQSEGDRVEDKWLRYAHTKYAYKKIIEYLKHYKQYAQK